MAIPTRTHSCSIDSESSAESELLIRDEKSNTDQALAASSSLGEYGQSRGRWYQWRLLYLLDCLLLVFALATVVKYHYVEPWQGGIDFQGDLHGFVPRMNRKIVEFKYGPEFASNHTEQSLRQAREAWKTLVPPGRGFLGVSDEERDRYNLPALIHYTLQPDEYYDDKPHHVTALGTSVVHALHCLYLIMGEYGLVVQDKEPANVKHMNHCIDYIRQYLMCSGDVTLAGEDFPGGSTQLSVPHVCRDWDQVYSYLEDRSTVNAWSFGTSEDGFVPPM